MILHFSNGGGGIEKEKGLDFCDLHVYKILKVILSSVRSIETLERRGLIQEGVKIGMAELDSHTNILNGWVSGTIVNKFR